MPSETDGAAYTYIVQCADGSLYTGWTNDIAARLAAHNAGRGAKYTRSRRPVRLVYYESFDDKQAAQSREWHIKRLTRAQKLALAAGFPPERLARATAGSTQQQEKGA